jgi:hypothetical protein
MFGSNGGERYFGQFMLQETANSVAVLIGLPSADPADEVRRLFWR